MKDPGNQESFLRLHIYFVRNAQAKGCRVVSCSCWAPSLMTKPGGFYSSPVVLLVSSISRRGEVFLRILAVDRGCWVLVLFLLGGGEGRSNPTYPELGSKGFFRSKPETSLGPQALVMARIAKGVTWPYPTHPPFRKKGVCLIVLFLGTRFECLFR